MIEFVYLLLALQPQTWWLWVALAMLFFSVVMANLAPVLIFPIFYKFTPLPEGDLTKRLLALAARAHTRVRGVFTMQMSKKTTAANAALMGLGNTRRIVIGDTMLDRYTPDEIEVVLAHELGHVWIYTHRPFLQTERLANIVGQRVVERESFEKVYSKLWVYEGASGVPIDDLLGPPVGAQNVPRSVVSETRP